MNPRSIDEMPKFSENPTTGTTPIEHYVRLVTYLGRVQSVTQSSEKGLTLRTYVKLDTKEWLRMYSRFELTSCLRLPDPVMLTAAALVKDETDLVTSEDVNDQMRTNAMVSINNLRGF